jgi:hypothetical protein
MPNMGKGMALTSGPLPVNPTYVSGQYYFANTGALSATAQASGFVYAFPWVVTAPLSISKIGSECTIAGAATSVVRIGVWNDTGNAYPGTLLLDAGTIDGTSATVQDITLGSALLLGPGLYWVGTVGQVAAVPTMRTALNPDCRFNFAAGTAKPSAGTTLGGYYQSGVTGAFGGSFTSTVNTYPSNQAARVHFKVS